MMIITVPTGPIFKPCFEPLLFRNCRYAFVEALFEIWIDARMLLMNTRYT